MRRASRSSLPVASIRSVAATTACSNASTVPVHGHPQPKLASNHVPAELGRQGQCQERKHSKAGKNKFWAQTQKSEHRTHREGIPTTTKCTHDVDDETPTRST